MTIEQEGTAGSSSSAGHLTVSHFLGEMSWLLTQSPLHRMLTIESLEWLVMPAIIHRQFYIFRDGERPVGFALWAKCSPDAEAKIKRGMLEPKNRLTLDDWISGEAIWLVDLVAPFATSSNNHREIMIADLISGPLKGRAIKLHVTDPATGERSVREVAADAGEKLKAAIAAGLDGMS